MLRHPLTTVAALLALALVGCATPAVIPPAGPPSDEQPLFASDEEALSAATEAYEEFLAVSSQILQEGGEQPERITPYLSGQVLDDELEGYADFMESGYRLIGQSEITNAILQQWISDGNNAEVIAYFCVSLAGTDVLDSEGSSVVNEDRPSESTFEVVFTGQPDDLDIARKQVWSDGSVCG